MKPGFLAAIGLVMSQGFTADMDTIHVPSYSWSGIGHVPFHFRTPNQRKRRRANRQQGSKARRIRA